MIGISKLYCQAVEAADVLRYNRDSAQLPSHLLQFSADKKPVVVWNATRACNLKCIHCYSSSNTMTSSNELSTDEAKKFIANLAIFGAPVMLFSGGEPLLRSDLFELAELATGLGMRAVISTNGTLLNKENTARLKDIGLSYIGVSIDGVEKTHDFFRGATGAFSKAMRGINLCKKAGIKVGIRFTINKHNLEDIDAIFDLLESEEIDRLCFYHLVYAGRGSALIDEDTSHAQKRALLNKIIDRTSDLFNRNKPKEVLTVDNHADGPFIYLRLLKENPQRAQEVLELLQMNEGNSSGNGIACVSWDGEVHPDQFWRSIFFGNVREKNFSDIWTDTASNELLAKMKNKKPFVKGRCAKCHWLSICGGNFRARAWALTGDAWAEDPACYLTDEEIGIK